MDKYQLLLNDLKEILETVGEINYVSHGKVKALDQEDTFTSVYISPEMDNFENYINGTGLHSYMNTFYVRLTAHVDCSDDDLLWAETRRSIIEAVLQDNAIWANIVDRDIVSVAHDDYTNFPRKAIIFLFEFRLREDCVV